jgi:hypothetical protein
MERISKVTDSEVSLNSTSSFTRFKAEYEAATAKMDSSYEDSFVWREETRARDRMNHRWNSTLPVTPEIMDIILHSMPYDSEDSHRYNARVHVAPRELVHYIDDYPRNRMACYAGLYPLSQYHQMDAVVVRSSHTWRNQRYCIPSKLSSFERVYDMLNEKLTEPTEHIAEW